MSIRSAQSPIFAKISPDSRRAFGDRVAEALAARIQAVVKRISIAEERQKMPLSQSDQFDEVWTVLGFSHFMSGPELKAASVALNAFDAEYTSWDIKNYSVGVRETPDAFEVWLCPYADLENRPKNYIGYGEYTLGKEVHYTISKDEYKITRARVVP